MDEHPHSLDSRGDRALVFLLVRARNEPEFVTAELVAVHHPAVQQVRQKN